MKHVSAVGYGNCDLIYTGLKRMPNEGEEIYSQKFGMYLGGGVSATLIALSRLGVPVNLGTFLGEDSFSKFIECELSSNKVNYFNLYKGTGVPVTISSIFNTKTDHTIVSNQEEFEITDNMKSAIRAELDKADIVIMHQGFYDIYKELNRSDKTMIFDTSWGDDMSVEYFEPYFELADYCTPNDKEAFSITGAKSIEEAMQVLEKYFAVPIIKTGHQGCMYKINGEIKSIPALKGIEPVDYTGAGDAFLAGFVYGIYNNKSLEDCIIFGNVTGGLSVREIGCITNHTTQQQLHTSAEEIRGYLRK